MFVFLFPPLLTFTRTVYYLCRTASSLRTNILASGLVEDQATVAHFLPIRLRLCAVRQPRPTFAFSLLVLLSHSRVFHPTDKRQRRRSPTRSVICMLPFLPSSDFRSSRPHRFTPQACRQSDSRLRLALRSPGTPSRILEFFGLHLP